MRLRILSAFFLTIPLLAGCGSDSKTDGPDPTPAKSKESVVIYEANPKVFAKTNALQAITARIDEIKALGTDVLWIMPIYEQGKEKSVGSPYCVKDYKAVNSEYGTLQDLKNLVSQAHSSGMKVILDWVANHTAWDNAWITEHKDWYTQNSGGQIISPEGMGWTDVADLNYSSTAMRAAMIDAMKYWVNEADVDGFRCDYSEGVPGDFWTSAISALKAIKGDELFMLAEGNSSSLYNYGFDAVYSWNFVYRLEDVYSGSKSLADIASFQSSDMSGVPEGAHRMRYITNHDMSANEHSPVTAFKGKDGAMAAFVFTSMMSDCVMIYSSQEIGYSSSFSFFTYNVMNWNSATAYTDGYKQFMKLYKETDAYRVNDPVLYQLGKVAGVWREGKDGAGVLTVVNLSGAEVQAKMPMEHAGEAASDGLTGESVTIPTAITLPAYGYKIYIEK